MRCRPVVHPLAHPYVLGALLPVRRRLAVWVGLLVRLALRVWGVLLVWLAHKHRVPHRRKPYRSGCWR